jgi:NAD(P)-dependent dehydrogenase (short-subunit alcohol dehydrogenase family)
MRLRHKVAIITGAGSGIGRATAFRFAEEGAAVLLFDLKGADTTCAEIQASGGTAATLHGDVSSSDDWAKAVAAAESALGPVDILCNIAGVSHLEDFVLDISEERFDWFIRINLKGTFLGMQAVLPGMIDRRYGKIVNTSSGVTLIGLPNHAGYTASKGGVDAVSRQVAIDMAPHNINVNIVLPGAVDTPIRGTNSPEANAAIAANIPLNRVGRPEDVAGAILFLASADADYITGASLVVDGGLAVK